MSNNKSLHWELDDRGVLAVSVKGHMPDFYEEKVQAPWHEVKDKIDTIIFREGITSIGAQAFKDCKALTYVEIPESLERIGYGAFEGCTSLDFVDFPDNRVLKHQQSPDQDVRISQKKVVMERRAFLYTPWAREELGDFIMEGGLLIEYYGADKNVVIPEGIEQIDAFVFRRHSIETVQFPKSLKVIGNCAFERTKLTKVMLPENLEKIQLGAFANIPTLEWVYFLSPNTEIQETAFKNSLLAEDAVISGHNPSTARTYAMKNGYVFQTNHRVVERFQPIPLVNGEPDGEFFLKRMNKRYAILGIMVNDETKTVEMVKSHIVKYFPIMDGWFEKKVRMMAEYVMYPCEGAALANTWYYTVNKYTRSYDASAGEAFYEQYIGGEGAVSRCRYEWYLSWEVNKWSSKLETEFLNDWLAKNPAYRLTA